MLQQTITYVESVPNAFFNQYNQVGFSISQYNFWKTECLSSPWPFVNMDTKKPKDGTVQTLIIP